MLWTVCLLIITLMVLAKWFLQMNNGMCRCTRRLEGHLVVVTGSNTGIGYETAKGLAERGARVILACRDHERGTTAATDITTDTGANVQFKHLDLASLASVRTFAADLIANETSLDVLINNAGVGRLDNSLTDDGIVVEAQINHFAPFLLTNLLLPLLLKARQGRIVIVSSVMHHYGNVDLDSIASCAQGRIDHQRAYSNSKLCNMLMALELSRRLQGTAVTVNTLHPGAVNSDIYRNMFWPMRAFVKWLMPKTCYEGAQTSIHLAVSPELERESGKYYSDCKISSPSESAMDGVTAKKLWDFSERIVKLNS